MNTSNTIKRSLMFSKGDDLYFLSYNVLLLLQGLKCECGKRIFKDHRKLAFLIDFISNRNLAVTLKQSGPVLNVIDRELFTRAYADGLLRLNQVIRLLFTLEKRGFIQLKREIKTNTIDVCVIPGNQLNDFFDKKLFKLEAENLDVIKAAIPKLNVLTLDTLLNRLFDNHGVRTWDKFL